MTTRRPLVVVSGVIEEISSGDVIAADTYLGPSGATVDGGTPSTSHSGVLTIDFGAVT